MAKVEYENIKKMIEAKSPGTNVEAKVKELRTKLKNISQEGAVLILANKLGITVKTEQPKATIKTIDGLRDGDDFVEIAGTCVQAYELRFYEVCPSCAKRIREQTGVFKCETHGVITSPAFSYLFNILMDDGTGVIRVTLFSRQIEKLLGMDAQLILKFRTKPEDFEEVKNELLGKLLAFRGACKTNPTTMRKEFTVKMVFKEPKDVTPRVETVSLLVKQQNKLQEEGSDDEDIDEDKFQEELHI
jgi:hypothetical protein